MTDPSFLNNNAGAADDFVGGNDKTPKFERDERFVTCLCDAKVESWDLGPGDNYIYVLPSSSDFASFFPDRRADYQIGKPYHRITVKRTGDKKPRNYRAPRDNELSKSYWRLYESLGANKALWKEVTSTFQAGGDWRRILNIIVMKPGNRMSPVKMLSVPDERGGNKNPGQQDALYVQVKKALGDAFNRIKATHPAGSMPFFPNTAVLLKLNLSFRGTIPQYNYTTVYEQSGGLYVQDLTALIGDPKVLDNAAAWCTEVDQLPSITEIDCIIRSPQACQVLGLQTGTPAMGSAPQTGFNPGQQAAPSFQPQIPQTGFNPAAQPAPQFQPQTAAPQFQPQTAAPQFQPQTAAPQFQPQTAAPTGFGAQPPVPPQQPAFQPGPAQTPAASPAPVNPVPNAAAASAMFAANLAKEMASKTPGAAAPGAAPAGGPF